VKGAPPNRKAEDRLDADAVHPTGRARVPRPSAAADVWRPGVDVRNQRQRGRAQLGKCSSCDVDCDATLPKDGDLWRSIVVDLDQFAARKLLNRRIFIAVSRTRSMVRTAAVNRRVAGSSPARGASSFNNLWTATLSPDLHVTLFRAHFMGFSLVPESTRMLAYWRSHPTWLLSPVAVQRDLRRRERFACSFTGSEILLLLKLDPLGSRPRN